MKKSTQYRVDIPPGANIEQMRVWCKKNLLSVVKVTYRRKYDEKRKKWVRDYDRGPMFRFREEGDAMVFKLMWLENKDG